MSTKNSFAMLVLATLAAVFLNTAVMAQNLRVTKAFDRTWNSQRETTIHDHRKGTPKGTTASGRTRVPPPRRQTQSGTVTITSDRHKARSETNTSGQNRDQQGPSRVNDHDHRTPTMKYSDASKMFSPFKQWEISGGKRTSPGNMIYSSSKYDGKKMFKLGGLANGKQLLFSQHSGIDLGWVKDGAAQWTFYKESGVETVLRFGEPFALRHETSATAYLSYGKRKYGIDLKRVGSPSYEWVILGGMPGTVVRRDARVVIYNLTHEEPLIYFDRRVGADIGWRGSSRAGNAKIRDTPQYAKKFRAATRALLMPGVILGDLRSDGRKR